MDALGWLNEAVEIIKHKSFEERTINGWEPVLNERELKLVEAVNKLNKESK